VEEEGEEYWQDVAEEIDGMEELEYQYPDDEYDVDWIQIIVLISLFMFFFVLLGKRRKQIAFRKRKPDIIINRVRNIEKVINGKKTVVRRKFMKRPIIKRVFNNKKIRVNR